MSIYLEKIKKIIGTFDKEKQFELTKYYLERSRRLLLDDKLVSKSKIHLLNDIKSICNNTVDNDLENDLMNHKVLQTRALILDLVSMDYFKDTEAIYKPEKWIKEIVKDIQETFLEESEEGKEDDNNNDNDRKVVITNINVLQLYNEKLLEEFRSIFITNVQYGTGGNQLLLNFEYYADFMNQFISYDFMQFLKEVEEKVGKEGIKK